MSTEALPSTAAALEPTNYRERLRFLPWYFWLFSLVIILLNAAQWGFLYWQVPYTESVVFLHYTIYFGVDMTGAWWRLLILPGAGLFLFLMNWVMMLRNYYRRPLIAWVALITSLLLNILLALGLYFIIQVNI
jgi:hypothetical protein